MSDTRHLLGIEGMSKDDVLRILDTAQIILHRETFHGTEVDIAVSGVQTDGRYLLDRA